MEVDLTSEGLSKGNFLRLTLGNRVAEARQYLADGKIAQALDKLGEALLVAPTDPSVLRTYADIAEARDKLPVATAIAEVAVEHNATHFPSWVALIEKYVRSGRIQDAAAAARSALTECSVAPPAARLQLGDMLARAGCASVAAEVYVSVGGQNGLGERMLIRAARQLCQLGRPDALAPLMAHARKKLPSSQRLAVLHAEGALAINRPDIALEVASEVAPEPPPADIACVWARAYIALARPAAALDRLIHVSTHGPYGADVAALRAVAARFLGKAEDASRLYPTALRRGAVAARLVVGYATSQRMLGLYDAALRTLDGIPLEQAPSSSLLRERATICADLGRRSESSEAWRRANMLGTIDAEALEASADVSGPGYAAMRARNVAEVLKYGVLAADERIALSFAFGHRLDAEGDHSSAAAVWESVNARVRTGVGNDVAALCERVRHIPETWARLNAESRSGRVFNHGPRPVFIVGMPRSGSRLVERILAVHPDVVAGGEATPVADTLSEIESCFGGDLYADALVQLDATDLDRVAGRARARLAERFYGARVVTDKLPGNFLHVGLLTRLFPDAVVVDCRRERLDNCLSIFTHLFPTGHSYAYRLEEIAWMRLVYESVMTSWTHQKSSRDAVWHLSYEDMVARPEVVTADLLAACHLPYAQACYDVLQGTPVAGAKAVVNGPISAARVGRWRTYKDLLAPAIRLLAPADGHQDGSRDALASSPNPRSS